MSPGNPSTPPESQASGAFTVTGAFVTNSRYGRFARRAMGVALGMHVLFALLFMALGVALMAWVNLVSIVLWIACIALARRNSGKLLSWLIVAEMLGHAVLATRTVGWAGGFQYYAWLLVPLAATSTISRRSKKVAIVIITVLTCLGMDLWLQSVTPLTVLASHTTSLLHTFNLATYFTITAVLAFVYAQTVAEAERGLHKHATTDTLTGLRNRRRLLELASDELARARRSGATVSIIIADIDHFKTINDRFGHPTGDQVIIGLAQCLRESVRHQDHVARWGGEEFMIVLPGIDLQGAYAAAERMRVRIEQLRAQSETDSVRCTASFGVSEWKHGRGETFEQCLDRADTALYSAKQLGRNRVCVSQPLALTDHGVAKVLAAGTAGPHSQTATGATQVTQAMPAHRNVV